MYTSFKHYFTLLGLKFPRAPTSTLEGDDHLLDDASNKNTCRYTILEDVELMKTSNRTRNGLKMHNLLKDKGMTDYIHYENECDGDVVFPLSLVSIYKETFDLWLYCAWPSDQQLPRGYAVFQFWGYSYIIWPSNIDGVNLGLFIFQNAHVGSKHRNNSQQTSMILMPYYGLSYYSGEWRRIA